MLLLTQQPPMVHWVSRAPQSSNGANTSALVVTLLVSGRSDPFKRLVHAATACSMVHEPVPWAYFSVPHGSKSLCRGHCVISQLFINILTFSIALEFSMKMKRS